MPDEVRNLCRLADISSKSLLLQVVRQETPEKMTALVEKIASQGGATRQQLREATAKPKAGPAEALTCSPSGRRPSRSTCKLSFTKSPREPRRRSSTRSKASCASSETAHVDAGHPSDVLESSVASVRRRVRRSFGPSPPQSLQQPRRNRSACRARRCSEPCKARERHEPRPSSTAERWNAESDVNRQQTGRCGTDGYRTGSAASRETRRQSFS